MPLIKCIECGKEYSSFAKECPNCACPTSITMEALSGSENKLETHEATAKNAVEVSIPDSRVEIFQNEFADYKLLQKVSFNEQLTIIREGAFSGCVSLKGIIIPSSVKEIEPHAFDGCHNIAVCLGKNTKFYRDTFEKDAIIVKTISDNEVFNRLFHDAVIEGYVDAQANLGGCFENGDNVKQDYKKALYWLELAANAGHGEAANHAGNIYYEGKGNVMSDPKLAVKYYTIAANCGNSYAQANLGTCYYNGTGVALDYSKALYWYSKAASSNNEIGEYGVGLIYAFGNGVAVDYNKAFDFFNRAAKKGHTEAMYNLAVCYLNGCGVKQDQARAIQEMKNAAMRGSFIAQSFLAKNGIK